jgi:hypothetical protein
MGEFEGHTWGKEKPYRELEATYISGTDLRPEDDTDVGIKIK